MSKIYRALQHGETLVKLLHTQFKQGRNCDLEIRLSRKQLYVHKCLIDAFFVKAGAELDEDRFYLDLSCYSTDVAETLLDLVYTGDLCCSLDQVENVYKAAVDLGFVEAQTGCMTYLRESGIQNVATTEAILPEPFPIEHQLEPEPNVVIKTEPVDDEQNISSATEESLVSEDNEKHNLNEYRTKSGTVYYKYVDPKTVSDDEFSADTDSEETSAGVTLIRKDCKKSKPVKHAVFENCIKRVSNVIKTDREAPDNSQATSTAEDEQEAQRKARMLSLGLTKTVDKTFQNVEGNGSEKPGKRKLRTWKKVDKDYIEHSSDFDDDSDYSPHEIPKKRIKPKGNSLKILSSSLVTIGNKNNRLSQDGGSIKIARQELRNTDDDDDGNDDGCGETAYFPAAGSIPDGIRSSQNTSKNTLRKTDSDLRIFNRWRNENLPSETRNIEEIEPDQLNQILTTFFITVRKNDNTSYEPDSIKAIQNSLDRYLIEKNYCTSILKGIEFKGSREVLKAKRKQLRQKEGLGRKKNCAKPILDEEEELLWSCGQLGAHNPVSLLNAVWWRNNFFGIKGRQEHRDMSWGDISIETDADGQQYLEYTKRDTNTKLEERLFTTRLYATPETPERCPVNILIAYTRKRPVSMLQPDSPFYLSMLPQKQMKPNTWYKDCALGVHSLGVFMKNMSEKAGLEKRTNHSGRKTTVIRWREAGIENS